MRVLIVITSVPFAKDYNTILNIAKKLRDKGHDVSIFLSGNGSYYLIRPDASQLSELGVKVYFCAHSAHQRGVDKLPGWAQSSSTYNLSRMMGEFDKVIVFN
ncbi:sulfur relay (sulfurtransferase) complex TusBCD TusD component (DsrE family) [Hydrogenivirga caldilitoris]|uniref:Sulfur relay (Sulfurtransferase) complex TusBCD TusD component (DsrE family) n=1 Tax=Hydrogenivirga caldilitoris TaxID=246264 RepID=A0A497XSE3_9AQUI|nr:DsrE family protein [Hydrogenivirga caldilitoris]RLJ71214.1 sulfur relay (sulfurtransferase) complex TusBCD TusD component (DsrE family) [Hydrogenivirga caldilitoris]